MKRNNETGEEEVWIDTKQEAGKQFAFGTSYQVLMQRYNTMLDDFTLEQNYCLMWYDNSVHLFCSDPVKVDARLLSNRYQLPFRVQNFENEIK